MLKDIVNNNTLVYRFNEGSCMPCVEDDMKTLNQIKESTNGENIIIITDHKNPKAMKIFSLNNKLEVPIYCFSGNLEILADKDSLERMPYFFMLDTGLMVDFTYISHSKYNNHTNYFLKVNEYLKNNRINY